LFWLADKPSEQDVSEPQLYLPFCYRLHSPPCLPTAVVCPLSATKSLKQDRIRTSTPSILVKEDVLRRRLGQHLAYQWVINKGRVFHVYPY
jgi:hypothetical protein